MGSTVQSVCEDRQGAIYFAIFGDALYHWQNGETEKLGVGQYLTGGNGSMAFIMAATKMGFRSVLIDHDQQIWAAADRAGLWQIQMDNSLPPPGSESLKRSQ